jgi:hypothetical protein
VLGIERTTGVPAGSSERIRSIVRPAQIEITSGGAEPAAAQKTPSSKQGSQLANERETTQTIQIITVSQSKKIDNVKISNHRSINRQPKRK